MARCTPGMLALHSSCIDPVFFLIFMKHQCSAVHACCALACILHNVHVNCHGCLSWTCTWTWTYMNMIWTWCGHVCRVCVKVVDCLCCMYTYGHYIQCHARQPCLFCAWYSPSPGPAQVWIIDSHDIRKHLETSLTDKTKYLRTCHERTHPCVIDNRAKTWVLW